ncbi:MAG TPA: PQQ-dependent sugar dehydrogenase [Puia sp.]|nr:PQQ-dependent sugar dehydrogenase [Puia sp.]
MKQIANKFLFLGLLLAGACQSASSGSSKSDSTKTSAAVDSTTVSVKPDVPTADVTLTLPAGFSSTIFAGGLGKARHIAVTTNGNVYVKLNSKRNGKSIVMLKDTDGDGVADEETDFGTFKGTGIAVKNGYLYATSDEEVYRFKLNPDGTVSNPASPEKIVTGLIARNEHEAKPIALDDAGNLYVTIGAFSNSCQIKDREAGSLGMNPCPVLDSAGGVWEFKADKADQTYKDGSRYATGIRNAMGIDWNGATNTLFVTQHGRDQLHYIFPKLYTDQQNAELPAECLYELHQGSDAGWPYIYYDQFQKKKILAPEYGGDGKKTGAEKAIDPIVAFPGHLAPNDLLFYTGDQFPARYKNGAFIAFHGSWNRAPEPQAGFFVVFVPFANGKPSGKWEIFANGFGGTADQVAKGNAVHRPCGLAQGPDGSLYITDDSKGTVWKITYKK